MSWVVRDCLNALGQPGKIFPHVPQRNSVARTARVGEVAVLCGWCAVARLHLWKIGQIPILVTARRQLSVAGYSLSRRLFVRHRAHHRDKGHVRWTDRSPRGPILGCWMPTRERKRQSGVPTMERDVLDAAIDVCVEDWRKNASTSAASVVGQGAWREVTRGWSTGSCCGLSAVADTIEILSGEPHQLVEWMVAAILQAHGVPPFIARVIGRLVANWLLAPLDPIDKAAMRLRVLGVLLCVEDGDLGHCPCLERLAQDSYDRSPEARACRGPGHRASGRQAVHASGRASVFRDYQRRCRSARPAGLRSRAGVQCSARARASEAAWATATAAIRARATRPAWATATGPAWATATRAIRARATRPAWATATRAIRARATGARATRTDG